MKLIFKACILPAALALLPAFALAAVPEGQPAPRADMKLLTETGASDFPGWEAYKGKVVVLEFWSTDCAPCVANIPRMNDLEKALHGKPIEFISVTPEKETLVRKFLETHPISGRAAVEGDAAWKAFGVRAVPQTVIISTAGAILRYTHPDALSEKALLRLLEDGSVQDIAGRMLTGSEPAFKEEAAMALFEVRVSSAPDSSGMSYGRSTEGGLVTLDYKGLGLRALLAKVYGAGTATVEISSGVTQRKYNFMARVPKASESAAKQLLREAIKAAYGAEVRSVKKARAVLVLGYEKNSAHEGFSPAPRGSSSRDGESQFSAAGARLPFLVEILAKNFGRPVIDETGLDGTYDMKLEWKAGDNDSLAAALKERFAMTLTPASREIEILEVSPADASAALKP